MKRTDTLTDKWWDGEMLIQNNYEETDMVFDNPVLITRQEIEL